jgi:general secretion pathway protein D
VPESRLPGLPDARGGLTMQGSGVGDFVFRIMRRGSGLDIDAALRAAASRGDARIISRPVVIAANNEPAEILVGSQRPFVQVSRSLPTDTPTRDQVVQYKDVGTRLKVRPTISSDGYVALSVTQEVNSATAETQFDAPVISTRTVDTHLLVRDSQTVVLGGLADRQREVTQAGVPVLSSIPVLGGLFGRTARRTAEVEFFLFITPRIIRSDEEADRATRPLERRSGVEGRGAPDGRDPAQPPGTPP